MVIGGSGLIGTKLTLEVSRRSGFYPAIFIGYSEPLRQLHRSSVVERRRVSSVGIAASRCLSPRATRLGYAAC